MAASGFAYWTSDGGALYRSGGKNGAISDPVWWDRESQEWISDWDWVEDLLEGRLVEEDRSDVKVLFPGSI